MTFEELKTEAKKLGYQLIGERRSKTEEQWQVDWQELLMLRQQRDKMKSELTVISKRIHVLSTTIAQHKKKREI